MRNGITHLLLSLASLVVVDSKTLSPLARAPKIASSPFYKTFGVVALRAAAPLHITTHLSPLGERERERENSSTHTSPNSLTLAGVYLSRATTRRAAESSSSSRGRKRKTGRAGCRLLLLSPALSFSYIDMHIYTV